MNTGLLLPVRIVDLLHLPGRLLLPVPVVHLLRVPGRPVQPVHHQVFLLRVPSGKHLPLLSTEAHLDALVSFSVPPHLAHAFSNLLRCLR